MQLAVGETPDFRRIFSSMMANDVWIKTSKHEMLRDKHNFPEVYKRLRGLWSTYVHVVTPWISRCGLIGISIPISSGMLPSMGLTKISSDPARDHGDLFA